jgi:hypothetical protein
MPANSTTKAPRNWPPQKPYLRAPFYSPRLTLAQRSRLKIKPEDPSEIPRGVAKGPCGLVKITDIIESSHPACGQAGLFAASDLKPGSFILEYLGKIHASPPSSSSSSPESLALASSSASTNPEDDMHAHSDYDLSLDRDAGLAIDADKMGNEARFINDYRGIKDRPNAEFREVWDPKRMERGMSVWVLPAGKSGKGKGIAKGEEILVSYGKGFWGARKAGEDSSGW